MNLRLDKTDLRNYTICVVRYDRSLTRENSPQDRCEYILNGRIRTTSDQAGFIMVVVMKQIPASQGLFTLVDDSDYKWLSQWKWYATRQHSGTFYVTRNEKYITIPMHRQILGLEYKDGKYADHIDGDGLNNQRCNLRICTKAENNRNRKPNRKIKSSDFKGVRRAGRGWAAKIKYNGKRMHIGSFADEIKAAEAYDKKAKELFGKFAWLNFR